MPRQECKKIHELGREHRSTIHILKQALPCPLLFAYCHIRFHYCFLNTLTATIYPGRNMRDTIDRTVSPLQRFSEYEKKMFHLFLSGHSPINFCLKPLN